MQKRRGFDVIEEAPDRPPGLEMISSGPFGRDGAVAAPYFQRLLRMKRLTVVPMMAISMIFFFGVTLLFGYQRPWMGLPLGGGLNLGYALILATYALCWVVALLYFAVATFWFDPLATAALAEQARGGERS